MIMVDTSVWVAHFKGGHRHLKELLHNTQVLCHDFIVGELACGNLKNRGEILNLLKALPRAPLLSQEEILYFIEHHALMGSGIGFVDAHLLASARLSSSPLWTLDNSLQRVTLKLGLDYQNKKQKVNPF